MQNSSEEFLQLLRDSLRPRQGIRTGKCPFRKSAAPIAAEKIRFAARMRGSVEASQPAPQRSRRPSESGACFLAHFSGDQCDGATYSCGNAPPVPKKNSSICSTRNVCAAGVHGCSRYSFSSIFCRSTHSPHACLETFLKIFCPNSESKGG